MTAALHLWDRLIHGLPHVNFWLGGGGRERGRRWGREHRAVHWLLGQRVRGSISVLMGTTWSDGSMAPMTWYHVYMFFYTYTCTSSGMYQYVLFTGAQQRSTGLVPRRCTAMPQLKTDRDLPVIQKLIYFCNPSNDKVLLSPLPYSSYQWPGAGPGGHFNVGANGG